jgi:hypothetical protein
MASDELLESVLLKRRKHRPWLWPKRSFTLCGRHLAYRGGYAKTYMLRPENCRCREKTVNGFLCIVLTTEHETLHLRPAGGLHEKQICRRWVTALVAAIDGNIQPADVNPPDDVNPTPAMGAGDTNSGGTKSVIGTEQPLQAQPRLEDQHTPQRITASSTSQYDYQCIVYALILAGIAIGLYTLVLLRYLRMQAYLVIISTGAASVIPALLLVRQTNKTATATALSDVAPSSGVTPSSTLAPRSDGAPTDTPYDPGPFSSQVEITPAPLFTPGLPCQQQPTAASIMLDAVHISPLTESQRTALDQLRSLVRNSDSGDEEERQLASEDRALLRFLRARKYDVAKAFKMIEPNLNWRKVWKPSHVTAADLPNSLFTGCWKFAGFGKTGMPVILAKASLWRPGAYNGVEEWVKHVCYFFEQNFLRMDTARTGVEKQIFLFDLSGFSLYHNDMRCNIQLVNLVQNYFPERWSATAVTVLQQLQYYSTTVVCTVLV